MSLYDLIATAREAAEGDSNDDEIEALWAIVEHIEAPRSYAIGLPVCLTIHDDGRLDITVDLAEADDLFETDPEGISDLQISKDVLTVSEVCARIGNAVTTTIYPARPTA